MGGRPDSSPAAPFGGIDRHRWRWHASVGRPVGYSWRVTLTIGLIVLLLLEGVPSPTAAPSTSHSAPPAAVSSAPARATPRAAPPTSEAGYRSLCLLGVLTGCPSSSSGPFTREAPPPLGLESPGSSWTNVTPAPGQPNPSQRVLPSMTYYPNGHEALLFGGASGPVDYQDTWAFAHNSWTQLISDTSCTPTTCPSPRADAGLAYYPPLNAILLFGGEVAYFVVQHVYNDTWLDYGGAWHNITATAGPAPSPRFGEAMTYDSLDGKVILFGGATQTGVTLNDTWTFSGTWTNATTSSVGTSFTYPSARAGASISDSPTGFLLMFGGESGGTILNDASDGGGSFCGPSIVAFWFHLGHWAPQDQPPCVIGPAVPVAGPSTAPPCGREYAAVGWSPKNLRFVVYGGFGYLVQTRLPSLSCSGGTGPLNDTWTYANPPGNGYDYLYAGDSGDPSNRTSMGFANDFTDGYFVIFGGEAPGFWGNETWRFYELVHAKLTGPSTIQTNASLLSFNVPFTVVGYGGSGELSYTFYAFKLRNNNNLIDGGSSDCGNFTSGSAYTLPYDGTWKVSCTPSASSYNEYRLTLYVWDINNATLVGGYPVSGDYATANWTFTVVPPETALLFSQYTKYFYTGFSFNNIFGAYLKVAGGSATAVSGTLGGFPVTFVQQSFSPFWWNSTPVDMGKLYPGTVLEVTADFGGWTLNASLTVNMVTSPSWLSSLFQYTGAFQSIPTSGHGAYNRSYGIYENYSWSLAGSSTFILPTPMLSGSDSFIPAIMASFEADSSGQLALQGMLSLTPPSLNFGIVSVALTVAVSLTGNFKIVNASQGISDIQWVSASATLTLSADLGVSVPLYGFDILGVTVGFTLAIDIKPSFALSLILVPTTPGFNDILPGLAVMVSQLVGAFTLAISAAVTFGIAIATVGIGIATSLALAFNITPTFHIGAGYLNGTFFATATFLWWNLTWNIVGPGSIYSWTDPPGSVSSPTLCPTCYNNGTSSTWSTQSRYYVNSGYDANVWNVSLSQGSAVSDIYPHTEVSGSPGYNGGYLFFSDDSPQVPVAQGLNVSGLRLDSTTNRLSALPSPNDPGFVITHPEATTLSDGSLYVVWAAVPMSETSVASPADLISIQLHGARFYPSNQSWGPIRTWTSWGMDEAYQLDGTGPGGTLVALIVPSFLVGNTAAERLVVFDLATGSEDANLSVTGVSEIVSVRGGLGEAVVESLGGNYSVLNLTTGATVPVSLPLPQGSLLISASFATNSASTLVLLFRNRTAAEVVLYDLSSDQVVARSSDPSASTVEALYGNGTFYVFEKVHTGIQGWSEDNGVFENLTTIVESNLVSFGLVQVGSSILVYSLVTNGAMASPVVTLEFAEVGATLSAVAGAPVTSHPSGPSSPSAPSGGTSPNYVLYLELVAVADVLLLAVIAVWVRRRSRSKDHPSSPNPPTPPTEGASPPPPSG